MRSWRIKRKVTSILIILLIIAGCITFKNCRSTVSIKPTREISLYLSKQQRVVKLPLEDYITGTVAAEMPANFGLEALKAQAVCARTYTLRRLLNPKSYPLGADVTDDIYNCQAYISQSEFKSRNPQNYKILWNKISQAVQDTSGQIMLYNGEVIDALYHSTCGGKTESAVYAWGREVPYLRSVDCDYCRESKYYRTCQVFTIQDIQKMSGVNSNNPINLSISEKTPSGRVKKMKINQMSLSGEKFRQVFSLPSTSWTFASSKGKLIINSRGYGHGLGLCQYGANGMAKAGKNYREILQHYYRDFDFYHLQWETD
ncbi:MAG: stage II sporulation protein D [Syntrophomonas sp.]